MLEKIFQPEQSDEKYSALYPNDCISISMVKIVGLTNSPKTPEVSAQHRHTITISPHHGRSEAFLLVGLHVGAHSAGPVLG